MKNFEITLKTFKTTFSAIIVGSGLIITGCGESSVSIYVMCSEHDQICSDIDTEGWCKLQRAELIARRYKQLESPADQDNQYRTLMSWRQFSHCIKTASNITRRTVSDRTSKKTDAYLTSLSEIDKIEQLTLNSDYPQLLFYHWSQNHSPNNLNKLLKLDNQQQLQTTELQLMMASYYAKVDQKKQISAQYQALSYLSAESSQAVDFNLYATMATTFYQQKAYKLAYIWSKVAESAGMKNTTSRLLLQHLNEDEATLIKLQTIADQTLESINSYHFVKPESRL